MSFDLKNLFQTVFEPEAGEKILLITDIPHGEIKDNPLWQDRREIAKEWHSTLSEFAADNKMEILPLISYPATGANNQDLPLDRGEPISLREALTQATVTLAPTEFSPTAPLYQWSKQHDDFRVATLPGVARRMQDTALSADHRVIAERCGIIGDILRLSSSADVTFSSGHKWHVDLRFRKTKLDDGYLPRSKAEDRLLNLPCGETFQVPYEGEKEGIASETEGEIPVMLDGVELVLNVVKNKIINVAGPAEQAAKWGEFFKQDPGRANIAEFAFGLNPGAVVWGNTLEDEKAGFHWAFGRSEHLGGVISPADFNSPDNVIHQDIIYAKDSPIQVAHLVLNLETGEEKIVIKDKVYTVF